MTGGRARLWTGLVAFVVLWLPAHAALAANSPTFRDCSFVGGLDPDFVKLMGATVSPSGNLTVPDSQSSVTLEASESSDAGDNQGHDTFSVTVSGPGIGPQTVSGTGVGHVTLSVPLAGVPPGGQYTIDFSATFDNGFHTCPGSMTPRNPASNPFVLDVVPGSGPPGPVVSHLRESHSVWREETGTTFSFNLSERATITMLFRKNGSIPRGAIVKGGVPGLNVVHFHGWLKNGGRLAPGRYLVVVTATDAEGGRSSPVSIRFVIRRRFARRA